jgi:hypothetical protein
MSLTVVTYGRIYARVLQGMNALARGTYDTGAQIADRDRRWQGDPHALRDLIVAKDAGIVTACCMKADGPYRARFTDFVDLAYSGGLPPKLPDRLGPLGAVYIQRSQGGDWVEGDEAASVEQIRQWRENPGGVFGGLAHDQESSPLGGFFKVVGARIPFTGYALRAEVATFDVDHEGNPPVLATPEALEDVLYAGCLGDAPIKGDDFEEAGYFRGYYQQCVGLIAAGEETMPPLKQE